MDIRQTITADLEEMYEVFVAAETEVCERAGVKWRPEEISRWAVTHNHLLMSDGERCYVAIDNGEIVGFSAATQLGFSLFLSALFIRPGYQGQGLGRRLFSLSMQGSGRNLMTITDSFQLFSNGLYGQYGLRPRTPIMQLSGSAARAHSFRVERAELDMASQRELDFLAYGFERNIDHDLWRAIAQPSLWLWEDRPVAYSYQTGAGNIGPIAARSPQFATEALEAECAQAKGHQVSVLIPGSSFEIMGAALNMGLRYAGPPGLLLTSRRSRLPRSLTLSSYWLM